MAAPSVTRDNPLANAPARSKRDFSSVLPSLLTWGLALLFLGPFLIRPVVTVLISAITLADPTTGQRVLQPSLLLLPLTNDNARESIINSFYLAR